MKGCVERREGAGRTYALYTSLRGVVSACKSRPTAEKDKGLHRSESNGELPAWNESTEE